MNTASALRIAATFASIAIGVLAIASAVWLIIDMHFWFVAR